MAPERNSAPIENLLSGLYTACRRILLSTHSGTPLPSERKLEPWQTKGGTLINLRFCQKFFNMEETNDPITHGCGAKQGIHKKRNTDGHETLSKVSSIFNHEGNVNQKYFKIHFAPARMAIIIKNTMTINTGEDVEERGPVIDCWWEC